MRLRGTGLLLLAVVCLPLTALMIAVGQESASNDVTGQEEQLIKATMAAQAATNAVVPAAPATAPAVVPAEAPATAPAEAPAAEVKPAPAEIPAAPAAATTAPAEVKAAPAEVPVAAPAVTETKPAAPVVEAAPAAPVAPSAPAAETKVVPAAESAPAAVVNAAPVTAEEKEKAAKLASQEEVRRQAIEVEGRRSFDKGVEEMKNHNYAAAAQSFEDALKKLPVRSANDITRDRATRDLTECDYRIALDIVDRHGDLKDAVSALDKAQALSPQDRRIARFKSDVEHLAAQPKEGTTEEPIAAPETTREQVQQLISEGRGFMALHNYQEAKTRFEAALALEPENKEAMRNLRMAAEQKFDASTTERKATAEEMLADVRRTWNPEHYSKIEKQAPRITQTTEEPPLKQKMRKIIIPEIEFRAADIRDVVEFLVKASRDADTTSPEQEKGVNIILQLQTGRKPSAPANADSPFAAPEAQGGVAQIPEITFNARYISLLSALETVTKVAGLTYEIDPVGNIVNIIPPEARMNVIVKIYNVEPSFIQRVQSVPSATGAGTGGLFENRGTEPTTATEGALPDLKAYFEKMGVPFPVGSSISYVSTLGKVIVANTAENLTKFEQVLRELNVVPKQVEIEARFVEVNQTDLEELGLEWKLNDNWELAHDNSAAPLGGQGRVQMDANSAQGGATKGLRFLGTDSTGSPLAQGGGQGTVGGILSFSSVLTNPELTMVLHALSQSGHADTLSAPRVTTRSGQPAIMTVATEYIYPTEFTVEGGQTAAGTANGSSIITQPYVVPGGFETKPVGVILEVTPEVSPEGNMINLTLRPRVVDTPIWEQYGSTIKQTDGSILTLNMPQPFFKVRDVQTSISIYDGATIVMGGLITEQLTTTDDKIPILGDIPLIGSLFKSHTSDSEKRNLLIFVTARLVDPAGNPLKGTEVPAGTTPAPTK